METLFLVVVVGGLVLGAWTVFKSFTKKVTPTVSSGGITTSSPSEVPARQDKQNTEF
jgi:hypothetical protein